MSQSGRQYLALGHLAASEDRQTDTGRKLANDMLTEGTQALQSWLCRMSAAELTKHIQHLGRKRPLFMLKEEFGA